MAMTSVEYPFHEWLKESQNCLIALYLEIDDEYGENPRDEVTDEWQEERGLPALV